MRDAEGERTQHHVGAAAFGPRLLALRWGAGLGPASRRSEGRRLTALMGDGVRGGRTGTGGGGRRLEAQLPPHASLIRHAGEGHLRGRDPMRRPDASGAGAQVPVDDGAGLREEGHEASEGEAGAEGDGGLAPFARALAGLIDIDARRASRRRARRRPRGPTSRPRNRPMTNGELDVSHPHAGRVRDRGDEQEPARRAPAISARVCRRAGRARGSPARRPCRAIMSLFGMIRKSRSITVTGTSISTNARPSQTSASAPIDDHGERHQQRPWRSSTSG